MATADQQRELGRRLALELDNAGISGPDRVQVLLAVVYAEATKQGFAVAQLVDWTTRAFAEFSRGLARPGRPRP